MGNLITYTDVNDRLSDEMRSLLSNNSTSTQNDTIIEAIITQVESTTFVKLSPVYSKTDIIAYHTNELTEALCSLVICQLYARKDINTTALQLVVMQCEEARNFIDDIANRKIILDDIPIKSSQNPKLYAKYDNNRFRNTDTLKDGGWRRGYNTL